MHRKQCILYYNYILERHLGKSYLLVLHLLTTGWNFSKPIDDTENMDDDSEEIFISGLLRRYCKRPAKLEKPYTCRLGCMV